jgi:hypothetical protein
MALRRRRRQAVRLLDAESGQSLDDRDRGVPGHADPRPRRLGARLLPELPEPTPGLHRRFLQRHQLERGQQAPRRRHEVSGLYLFIAPTPARCAGVFCF